MQIDRYRYYTEQHMIRFLRREANAACDHGDIDLADEFYAYANAYVRRFPFNVLLRSSPPVGSLKRRLEDFRIQPPF